MNKEDLVENIEFHPIEEVVGNKRYITKSFCLESGRRVYDEEKRLIGLKINLHKSSTLLYEILENETSISLTCALNDEALVFLNDEFDLTNFEKMFEGFVDDRR